MQNREYTVIYEYDSEDKVWLAHVPALNGMTTQGRTHEEAREMAREAIEGYLESLAMDGIPFPDDTVFGTEKLSVAV